MLRRPDHLRRGLNQAIHQRELYCFVSLWTPSRWMMRPTRAERVPKEVDDHDIRVVYRRLGVIWGGFAVGQQHIVSPREIFENVYAQKAQHLQRSSLTCTALPSRSKLWTFPKISLSDLWRLYLTCVNKNLIFFKCNLHCFYNPDMPIANAYCSHKGKAGYIFSNSAFEYIWGTEYSYT